MMTLTEKRLQELEHKVAVACAKMNEYDEKISEYKKYSEDLSKAIASYRELENSIKLLRNELITTIKENLLKINKSYQDFNEFTEKCQPYFNDFDSLKNDYAVFTNTSKKYQSENTEKCRNIEDISNKNGISIVDIYKKISEMSENQIKYSALTQEFKDKISAIETKIMSSQSQFQEVLTDNISKIDKRLNYIACETNEKINKIPKSYPEMTDQLNICSNEINGIKSDISIILSTLSQKITQKPNDDYHAEKIKSIESSISQIYTLLKKYEIRN